MPSTRGSLSSDHTALTAWANRSTSAGLCGVYTGRKPALTTEQARELVDRATAGESKTALAKEFKVSRETVYSYLRAEDAAAMPASR